VRVARAAEAPEPSFKFRGPSADLVWMEGLPPPAVQREREIQFIQSMRAFMRRDFALVEAGWRPDVVLAMPGASWLAGTHRGYADVSRCVLGLREVLASEDRRITFLHEGDQMIVRHDITVRGPRHEVGMTLRVRIRYDADEKAEAISLEPDDLALFDHVLNTKLQDQPGA
jgi:ketosteroid isomerase-like protein